MPGGPHVRHPIRATVLALLLACGCQGSEVGVDAGGNGGATGGGGKGGSAGGGAAGRSGTGGAGGATSTCSTPPPASALFGWAAVSGMGVTTTTGGGNAAPQTVTTESALASAVGGTGAAVI